MTYTQEVELRNLIMDKFRAWLESQKEQTDVLDYQNSFDEMIQEISEVLFDFSLDESEVAIIQNIKYEHITEKFLGKG